MLDWGVVHAFITAGQLRLAEKTLRESAREHGQDPEYLGCAIRLALRQERLDDAREHLQTLTRLHNDSFGALWYRAQVMRALGEFDDALAALDLIQAESDSAFPFALRAGILWFDLKKSAPEVRPALNEALRRDPNEPLAREIEFAIADDRRDAVEAARVVQSAVTSAPETEDTAELLARYLSGYARADLAAIRALIRQHPGNALIREAYLYARVNGHFSMRALGADGQNVFARLCDFISPPHRPRDGMLLGWVRELRPFVIFVISTTALLTLGQNEHLVLAMFALWGLTIVLMFIAVFRSGLLDLIRQILVLFYRGRG